MNTTKHPQRRKSGNPANRAAEERVAAERAAAGPAKSAASAVQTTKQPPRRKSLACRFGRHHWEPKRAKRARRVQKWRLDDAGPTRHTSGIPSFRECTECGRRQYLWPGYRDDPRGLGGSGDGDGDDTRDPGAGQAGRRWWFDDGDSGDGGDGGDWGGGD